MRLSFTYKGSNGNIINREREREQEQVPPITNKNLDIINNSNRLWSMGIFDRIQNNSEGCSSCGK